MIKDPREHFEAQTFHIVDFDVIEKKKNGTMCQASILNDSYQSGLDLTEFQVYNFTGTELGTCYECKGSHSKTFWIYFTLRMIYQVSSALH